MTVYPHELVRGLYYYTDKGQYASTSPQKTVFSEQIDSGQGINFENTLAFTFDDVLFDNSLTSVLDLLRDNKCQAVFFIQGNHLARAESGRAKSLLQRIISDGHTLGNHSFSHPAFDRGLFADGVHDVDDILVELQATNDLVDAYLGYHYEMEYVRPPFGLRGNNGITAGERLSLVGTLDAALQLTGQKLILWHINSCDADNRFSVNSIVQETISRIAHSQGGSVLFHSNAKTAQALALIFSEMPKVSNTYGFFKFGSIKNLLDIKYAAQN